MYNLNQKLTEKDYKFQLYKARESVIIGRIEKIKKMIAKLQNGLATRHLDRSIRQKFEERTAQESETALKLVGQLKQFRAQNGNYLAS
jgi:hypothetical protein